VTRAQTLAGYAVIATAIASWQWAAWRRGRTTLGRLAGALAAWRPSRWPLLAAWLWLGWHVFARATWP
jgi:hypothetical protein